VSEFVIKTRPKPGWPCPSCGGLGTMANGSVSIEPGEHGCSIRVKTGSTCPTCLGFGRVKIVPFDEAERSAP
jgi:hypothetical protein